MTRRFLFICGKARMRSPTAADVFASHDGIETDFAGLSADADEKISSEQINWADELFVMETRQKKRLTSQLGPHLKGKKIRVLGIPDRYSYMEPDLVEALRRKMRAFLP